MLFATKSSADVAELARTRGQVFHACSRKNTNPIYGGKKKRNCTAWPGTANSAPDAPLCPDSNSVARNVDRRIGMINNGIAISTTSGVGSRRKIRSSFRLIAKLRRRDIFFVMVVAMAGQRKKHAVEAGVDDLDRTQLRGLGPKVADDTRGGVRRVGGFDAKARAVAGHDRAGDVPRCGPVEGQLGGGNA